MNILMLSEVAGMMRSVMKLAFLRCAGRVGACAVAEAALLGKVMIYELRLQQHDALMADPDDLYDVDAGDTDESSTTLPPLYSLVVPIDLEALITRRHRCAAPNVLILSVQAILNRIDCILSSGYVPVDLEHVGADIIKVTHYQAHGLSVVSPILGNMRGIKIIFENIDDLGAGDLDRVTAAQKGRLGTSIKKTFLPKAKGVEAIELPNHLKHYITSIDNNFLWRAQDLKSLDLTPFSNVTTIGEMFMVDCESLARLDLSPLCKVQSIGSQFLHSCTSLTELDLTPLRHSLVSIGIQFLGDCKKLKSVNLAGLERISIIKSGFMRGCVSLEKLDLTPLGNVSNIDYGFLAHCSGLTSTLNFSALVSLSRISEVQLLVDVPTDVVDLTPIQHAINFRSIQLESV